MATEQQLHNLHPHQQQQQQQQAPGQAMYGQATGADLSHQQHQQQQHYPPSLYNPHSMSDASGYTLQTLGSSPGNNAAMTPVNRYSPQQQQQQQQQRQQQQQQQVGHITVECRPLQQQPTDANAAADMHRISATTMAPPNWTGPASMTAMPGVNTSPLGSNVSATPPSGDTSEESGDDITQVKVTVDISIAFFVLFLFNNCCSFWNE